MGEIVVGQPKMVIHPRFRLQSGVSFNFDCMSVQLQVGLHLFIWMAGLVFFNLPSLHLTVGYFNSSDGSLLVPSLYGTLFNAIIFYGNWKVLLKHYSLRRFQYYLLLIPLLAIITLIESGLDLYLATLIFPERTLSFVSDFFIDNFLIHFVFFLLPSSGCWIWERWKEGERVQQKLSEEKLKAELAFMRSQINPHFLFNTLNNLFASAYQFGDTKTANNISILADMMRYMLYESTTECVTLKEEFQYLKDYVHLQKMRFDESDDVHIQLTNKVSDPELIRIPPMVFIPFLENAFKHGIRLQERSEVFLEITQNHYGVLNFICKNTLHPDQEIPAFKRKKDAGFGLNNVKNRLQLLFPDKHQLTIQKAENKFKVTLKLEL